MHLSVVGLFGPRVRRLLKLYVLMTVLNISIPPDPQDGRVESGGLRRSELPPTAEDLELLWQDVSFLLEEEVSGWRTDRTRDPSRTFNTFNDEFISSVQGADLGRTSLNSTVNSTQHGSSHGGEHRRPS